MNREEQIIAEAKKYYYDDINCHNAFLHGVEWADEHPVDVWHPTSEEPDNLAQIVCVCNMFGSKQVCSFRVDKGNLIEWKRIVEIRHIDKWAYFNELIED